VRVFQLCRYPRRMSALIRRSVASVPSLVLEHGNRTARPEAHDLGCSALVRAPAGSGPHGGGQRSSPSDPGLVLAKSMPPGCSRRKPTLASTSSYRSAVRPATDHTDSRGLEHEPGTRLAGLNPADHVRRVPPSPTVNSSRTMRRRITFRRQASMISAWPRMSPAAAGQPCRALAASRRSDRCPCVPPGVGRRRTDPARFAAGPAQPPLARGCQCAVQHLSRSPPGCADNRDFKAAGDRTNPPTFGRPDRVEINAEATSTSGRLSGNCARAARR
jgi:hypothetical protein